VRVLVAGDSTQALCVGGLLAADGNDVVFATTAVAVEKGLRDGLRLKMRDTEYYLKTLHLYKDSSSAGLFDLVLCGVTEGSLESQRSIIRPALAQDSVAIPLPSSGQCDEILCRIVGEEFVVHSNATIPVSVDGRGDYVLSDTPRMSLKERGVSDSWRLDFISTALNSAGIEVTTA